MTRKRFVKLMRGFSTTCYVALRYCGVPVSSGMIFTGRKGYQLPEGSSWLKAAIDMMEEILMRTLELAVNGGREGGDQHVRVLQKLSASSGVSE